jgi:hypothetical protein
MEKAIMPTKCVAQMPMPMATAPPVSHRRAMRATLQTTLDTRNSAV